MAASAPSTSALARHLDDPVDLDPLLDRIGDARSAAPPSSRSASTASTCTRCGSRCGRSRTTSPSTNPTPSRPQPKPSAASIPTARRGSLEDLLHHEVGRDALLSFEHTAALRPLGPEAPAVEEELEAFPFGM